MRLLFLTDTHIRGTSPAGRTDNFYETMINKLRWAVSKANEGGIDGIIHGGDLFDTENPSEDVAGRVGEVLNLAQMPIYIVPGNHDLYGYQLHSLPYTKLGLVARCVPHVQILSRETGVVNHGPIELVGQHYHPQIDRGQTADYHHGGISNHRILIYHGQLMDRAPGIDMPHTLIDQFETDAHLVLAGHYHPGWPTTTRPRIGGGQTVFYNPGSFARNEAQEYNLQRLPQALLIESQDDPEIPFTITTVPVDIAKPGTEVLTRKHLTEKQSRAEATASFRDALREARESLGDTNLLDTVSEDVDPEIRNRALNALAQIHTERPELPMRRFSELAIQNFQSHVQTTIQFAKRITAIVGQSDAGKSAILRAIRWAAYDQPHGVGFLRVGEKSVCVTLKTEDEHTIERARTATSAGHLNVDGEEYRGFSRALPPQLMQAHGMVPIEVQGLRFFPSFATQLEGPFLLGLSPGQRAIALSPLGGSERIDAAVKQLSSEHIRTMNQVRSEQQTATILNEQLRALQHWPDRLVALQEAMAIGQRAEVIQRRAERMGELINRLQDAYDQQATMQDQLFNRPAVEDVAALSERIRAVVAKRNEVGTIATRADRIARDQAILTGKMGQDHSTLIKTLRSFLEHRKIFVQLLQRVVHTTQCVEEAQGLVTQASQQLTELQTELAALAAAGAVCPTCHRPISEGHS